MHWSKLKSAVLPLGAALAVLIAGALPAAAQQTGSVRGTVLHRTTQRPIAQAQVFLPGTRNMTVTDEDGRFVLPNIPAGRVNVRARALGYTSAVATITVTAGLVANLDFSLSESVIRLDEVVVTGVGGSAEKKQLGNTFGTIDASTIEDAPVLTFSEAMAAREPGVAILPSSGLTGEGARIRIRGTSSLSQSNEPVVYVDGVRIDNGGGFAHNMISFVGGGGGGSRLDDINPETIERIEVLKGAAAATLFGSEANSGVIQIITKRGSAGAPRFSFRVDQGVLRYPSGVYKPNAGFTRWADAASCQLANASEDDPVAFCQSAPVSDRVNAIFGTNVAPFEVFERTFVKDLFETGHTQTYSGQVTGGTDNYNYFVSARFTSEDGAFGAEDLGPARDLNRRIQTSTNITLFPRERLRMRVSGFFTDTRQETPNNNNNIFAVVSLAMFGKPQHANCQESINEGLGGTFGQGSTPGTCAGPGNPTGQKAFMTVRESMQQVMRQDTEHYNASLNLRYNATTALEFDATFGADFVNSRSFEFAAFGYALDNFTGNNTDGSKSIAQLKHRELTLDVKGTWNTRFADFSSTLVFGGQGFITEERLTGGFGSDFPGPGLEVAGAAANQTLVESALSIVNAGGYIQEQLGFRDWAYLTVGGRLDRNSAFGENESAAFYPKVSLSVILSDLPSWRSELVSTLRIRGAVGQSGLQPGAFDKLTTFGPGPVDVGPGLAPNNLGNPDLKPEKTTEWEVGAEIGLFNNRAAIDGTYWYRKTKDALIARQFPVTGGFRAPQLDNIGELSGKGFELKLNALAIDKPDLSVNLFVNGSYISEKIISMGDAPPIKVGGSYPRYRNFLIEGFAPGTFFGAQLIPQCGAAISRTCWTPGSTVPFDSNGDGVPDSEAEFKAFLGAGPVGLSDSEIEPMLDDEDGDGDLLDHLLGKPTPDWQGAFGTTISIKQNFQIYTLFEYKTGDYWVSNLTDAFRKSNSTIGRNTRDAAQTESDLLNPNASTDAKFAGAMLWATHLRALAPASGLNLSERANFVRWRELSLTYTAPRDVAGKFGMNSLAITLTGRNLALFSGYSGIDPETNAVGRNAKGVGQELSDNFLDGVEAFGFPVPRRYGISVRFGF